MSEAGIRGVPQGVETVQRTTPKDAIEKMLEEDRKFSARIKLTWNPNKPPGVPNDKMVGEVNLYLPYMSMRKRYFVQNAKVFLSNGEPTALEFIRLGTQDSCQFCVADGESWRRRPSGDVCCLYAEVAKALDVFMADAIKRDPLLCKNKGCGFVAGNVDDYADHRMICGQEQLVATAVDPVAGQPHDDPTACTSCPKSFRSMHGLLVHTRRMHKSKE